MTFIFVVLGCAFSLIQGNCELAFNTTGYDCYPSIYGKPNVTEELCLAQGCCWNAALSPSCRFGATPPQPEQCQAVSLPMRLPCRNLRYHEAVRSAVQCEAMGCCWDPTANETRGENCYQPQFNGYQLVEMNETNYGLVGVLTLPGNTYGPFGNDIKRLELRVWYEENSRLRIRIYDPSHPRYEVLNIVNSSEPALKPKNTEYEFGYTTYPFGVSVARKSSGVVLFNSTPVADPSLFGGMVFENQYLEISTQLFSNLYKQPRIYGLGEDVAALRLNATGEHGQHYTFFARDQVAGFSQHVPEGGNNIYGVHPFYLHLEDDGQAHGVFLLNSNALEVIVRPGALTYRTVGGIIDLFVFLGPTPNEVVAQYLELVGKPILPAYWHLGFHLCKWGYDNVNNTRAIVQKMRAAGVPQDAQWNDIDYMDYHAIFTLDPKKFPVDEMRAFVDDLHNNDQYYVNIHDPGISIEYPGEYNYTAYHLAQQLGVFIKTRHASGSELVGKVWPGWVVYPDFFHPNAESYWFQELKKFHDIIPFDGAWIDMNEPSNFCDGEMPFSCRSVEGSSGGILPPDLKVNLSPEFQKTADIAYPFDPYRQPYVPGEIDTTMGGKGDLDQGTVAMSAVQHTSLHYNLHSLYGHSEIIHTMNALTKIRGKRSLVVSRSTYAGSGKYGSHWLGDNYSSWLNMRNSIPGILAMNIFGIPLVGADICGFLGDTTPELCVRWHQLGSFYPFSRNHNHLTARPQAPVDFDEQTNALIKQTILNRYLLLPYLYTLFFQASTKGTTVVRPIFFEFPQDVTASLVEMQFMVGSALLISPVVYEGHTNVTAYFPDTEWYSVWTGERLNRTDAPIVLDAPLNGNINAHIRGGSIIPTQSPGLTTTQSRNNSYGLIVALGNEQSMGELFIDDGHALDTLTAKSYLHLKYDASMQNGFRLASTVVLNNYVADLPVLDTITVYGLNEWDGSSDLLVNNDTSSMVNYSFNQTLGVLKLFNLGLSMHSPFTITQQAAPVPPEETTAPETPKVTLPPSTEPSPTPAVTPVPAAQHFAGLSTGEIVVIALGGALVVAMMFFMAWYFLPCLQPYRARYEGYDAL